MPTPAITRTAAMQAIREHGPMTITELAARLQLPRSAVSSSVIEARLRHGVTYFRIDSWRRHTGGGGRETPVYALGPGLDAPRPEMGKKAARERSARYYEKMKHIINARARLRNLNEKDNPFAQLLAPAKGSGFRQTPKRKNMADTTLTTFERVRTIVQKQGPVSSPRVRELLGLSASSVNAHLRRLKDEDTIHIAGWEKVRLGRHKRLMPVWAWGKGEVELPRRTNTRSVAAAVLDALPGTLAQVAKKLGVGTDTVRRHLARQRANTHIGAWVPNQQKRPMPVYYAGAGTTAEVPPELLGAPKIARKPKPQPPTPARRTAFAGGVNPWTQQPAGTP